jgi:hypothetical protein
MAFRTHKHELGYLPLQGGLSSAQTARDLCEHDDHQLRKSEV